MHPSTIEVWDEPRQAALIVQVLSGEVSLVEACQRHGLSRETVRSWVPVYRHRTLQALDEKLLGTSLIESVNADRLGSATYTGNFDDVAVADLLQTCQIGEKDALITITRGGERSAIWCERGNVVDAESGRLGGEAAIYRILAFDSGQVSADFRLHSRRRTIELPCHVLLLEAARHKDECARLLVELKGSSAIFLQAPGAWAVDATLNELQVISLCDGERNLAEVLAASDLSDLETLTALASLVRRGYVLLDWVSPPSPPATSNLRPEWARESSLYLSLPPAEPAAPRARPPTALLLALMLALGGLLWFGVESVYAGLSL
jgi:uncharacterized protein DUF4388/helix-turn-helix protein